MKLRLLLLLVPGLCFINVLLAASSSFIQTKDYGIGVQKIYADTRYERMPVFQNAGSHTSFGEGLQYTSESTTLNVYTCAGASFNLNEEEGTNYNYEKVLSPSFQLKI